MLFARRCGHEGHVMESCTRFGGCRECLDDDTDDE